MIKKLDENRGPVSISTNKELICTKSINKDLVLFFICNFMYICSDSYLIWSGGPDLNRRPSPWQGDILAAELPPHLTTFDVNYLPLFLNAFSYVYILNSELVFWSSFTRVLVVVYIHAAEYSFRRDIYCPAGRDTRKRNHSILS